MADIIKWGLLVAGIVALIALIFVLPVADLNIGAFSDGITTIVTYAGEYFKSARGLINSFTTPAGVAMITALLSWFFAKFLVTNGIKIVAWIYHFIFK